MPGIGSRLESRLDRLMARSFLCFFLPVLNQYKIREISSTFTDTQKNAIREKVYLLSYICN